MLTEGEKWSLLVGGFTLIIAAIGTWATLYQIGTARKKERSDLALALLPHFNAIVAGAMRTAEWAKQPPGSTMMELKNAIEQMNYLLQRDYQFSLDDDDREKIRGLQSASWILWNAYEQRTEPVPIEVTWPLVSEVCRAQAMANGHLRAKVKSPWERLLDEYRTSQR